MRTRNRAFAAGSAVLIAAVVAAVAATASTDGQVDAVASAAATARQARIDTAYGYPYADDGTDQSAALTDQRANDAAQPSSGADRRASTADRPAAGTKQPTGGVGRQGEGPPAQRIAEASGSLPMSQASRRWYQDHPDDDVPGSWPGRGTGWPGHKHHPRPGSRPTATSSPTQSNSPTQSGAPGATDVPTPPASASQNPWNPPTTPPGTPTAPAAEPPVEQPPVVQPPVVQPPVVQPPVDAGKGTIPRRSGLPWASGVFVPSDSPAEVEKFAAWRGRPVDVVVAWSARQSWSDIVNPTWLYDAWKGTPYTMAFGVAPVPEGDASATMAGCAAGAYDDKWTAFGSNIKAAGLDHSVIRLGWEFNGNWYKWQAGNPAQFAECYRRIVTAVRTVAPKLLWDWTVNRGTGQSVADPRQAYPGDAYVDLVGVDSYDMWPGAKDEAAWQQQYAGDYGLKFWADFAQQHGKKITVPEWGVYPTAGQNGGDNAFYIAKMEAFFAAQGSRLGYESYFNENAGYYGGAIYAPTQNPAAAAKYKAALAAVSSSG